MAWKVTLKESVIQDLQWFGRKDGRTLLKEAQQHLAADPRAETRNMKSLRSNPIAQRELRLFGKYRVLFNVDAGDQVVTIVLVGEKRGYAPFWCRGRSLPNMKVIPLSEAKARLSHYGHLCHEEPVIVTVNGVPSFQLVPLAENDDLIDRLLEHNPRFRELLQRRLRERNVPVGEAARHL